MVSLHEQRDWTSEWVAQRMPGAIYRAAVGAPLTMLALTEGVARILGYPVATLLARGEHDYAQRIHPDDRARVRDAIEAVVEHGQPAEIEYRVARADGSICWVRQKAWPSLDRPATVEGIIVDISHWPLPQQREAERQLAHARQQRSLFELATHPAVAEGRVQTLARVATEKVAELVAVERVSVWLLDGTGDQLELVDLFVRSCASHEHGLLLRARDYPAYFEALRTGRSIDAHDAVVDLRTREFADGYLRPLGIGAMLDAAIRNAGKVAGVVCLEHVGGPRRWQKHEIEFAGEVADQLSLALLSRARIAAQAEQDELRAQLIQSQKMDALGRLAGGVAHDFNNILMAISGNAEILLAMAEDPLLRRAAQEIVDASTRAGELVGQLLRFARREPLDLRTIELGGVVMALEGMLRRLLDKRLQLRVERPELPLHVRATETLIQQILTNLVVNARDAVGEDGHIDVVLDRVDRAEPGEQPVAQARLRVVDDGQGIPAELQAKVFEPFFTTKRVGEGTGLGLATVYSIASRLGGSVELDSEPGRGTTVTVCLPLLAGDP